MGRLIEQQAVIECLNNTAKYYEREDADEWTKGIHYGLLHGVDNILDNVPTVEDMYDKDTVLWMFRELQLEIEELDSRAGYSGDGMPTFSTDYIRKKKVNELVQQKINSLKE